jgi:hypothetical protein
MGDSAGSAWRKYVCTLQRKLKQQEIISMVTKTNPTKIKRLSKSKRAHVRKMKQEARAAGIVYKAVVQ